jgi:hypothetical protein
MPLKQSIATIRDSVCGVLRIKPLGNQQFNVALVGTAWCIVENRYFITAHHIFNNEKSRDPNDRFILFSVPNNGPQALHVSVISFPLEDSVHDMAVIEIDATTNNNFHAPSVPVTFRDHADGERILTYGFPSPVIVNAVVDLSGNWAGGNIFLRSHANEGIISGQFNDNNDHTYELNVGWYPGESGGPIFSLEPLAAFSLMQRYRKVNTVDGIVPGPRQGKSLKLVSSFLQNIGTQII